MWNVNGINSVLTKGALQEIFDNKDPDIICFNEIKIDQEKLNAGRVKETIPLRYSQYWNCCKGRKGYAGTAVFTKVRPMNVYYD